MRKDNQRLPSYYLRITYFTNRLGNSMTKSQKRNRYSIFRKSVGDIPTSLRKKREK